MVDFIPTPPPGLVIMTKLYREMRICGCASCTFCLSQVCLSKEMLICALQMDISELLRVFGFETSV